MKQVKFIASLLAFLLGFAVLAGCGGGSTPTGSGQAGSGQSTQKTTGQAGSNQSAQKDSVSNRTIQESDPGNTTGTAVLCAVFDDPDSISRYELGFDEEITPELLMKGLSNLTGLDFDGVVFAEPNGIYVEWDDFSTLVTGLDGREQNEEFFMSDTESLRWFMMDSLWYTLRENFGDVNVYYTRKGENQLIFDNKGPQVSFDFDSPYQGSNYYLNGNQGGER